MSLLTRQVPWYVGHSSKLEVAGRIALPCDPGVPGRTCCLGYATSNLLERSTGIAPVLPASTPAHANTKIACAGDPGLAIRGTAPIRTPPLHKMERAARVELASSAWKAEAPAAIPCSLHQNLAGATGVEPVPPDRQSATGVPDSRRFCAWRGGGVLAARPCDRPYKSFGCECRIRTCMHRVRAGAPQLARLWLAGRAGDPVQLNDLAVFTKRGGNDQIRCFLAKEVTVAFTTPRNSAQNKSGCRGANRTLMTSFKDSRPTIERPDITHSIHITV